VGPDRGRPREDGRWHVRLHEVRTIVIHTLGELVDRVTPSEPDPITGRRRDAGVYRGSSNASNALFTSLDRLGGINPPHTKADLEEHILRNFIRYSRPHLGTEPVNDWEQLVSAQHHGVPTRLLDWTYSPLVAAFFATRPSDVREERDRAVWRLDWKMLHEKFQFPALSLLIKDLDVLFGKEGHFTPWALMRRGAERDFACLLEPPSLDQRIVAQAAVFTLCSDKTRPFDAFLSDHGLGGALTKYVMPASEVGRMRDQLDLVGVDERRLFPDLDGVAEAIRRYYA
jgi:FRG domain